MVYSKKYKRLKDFIAECYSAVIAFSGGLDSGLLAKVAFDVLGKNVLAVTAKSPTYPKSELIKAKATASYIGIRHRVIYTAEFKDERFLRNWRDRCYWCKRELFCKLQAIASKAKLAYIFDGTNYDDRNDVRPGLKAKEEFGVVSPLYECKFTKSEIRELAKKLALPFWNSPSGTCLSSRIPFGEKITPGRISRVEKAESILQDFLKTDCLIRARDHNDILRIEIDNREWTKLTKSDITNVVRRLKQLGYRYITLDCEGYIPAGKR
jgi:uncharacterized protein